VFAFQNLDLEQPVQIFTKIWCVFLRKGGVLARSGQRRYAWSGLTNGERI
jgi:hypothetical protein